MVPPSVASVVLLYGGASVMVMVVLAPPMVGFRFNANMELLSTVTFS